MSLFSRLASPYRFHDDVTTAAFGGGSWHGQSLLGNLFERIDHFLDDLFDWLGGNHGGHGEPPAEPAAPTIQVIDDATHRLPLTDDGGTIRGVIGDPTDPALTNGIALEFSDADTARHDLQVTVESSDDGVARAALDDNDVLRIAPVSTGNATITVTVSDGERESQYTFDYAAADSTATNNDARFHTGASDTSAAIVIGDDMILVGDDEDQTLRLYDHDRSGAPLASFDLDAALGLEEGDEVDIESVVDAGNGTYYWLGSLSNSERSTVFATHITGNDADSLQVEVTGQFDGLYQAIADWAAQNRPDVDFSAFEIEGSAYANGTLYLGLRAPIDSDGRALVLPVANVDDLMAAGNANEAEFGPAIALDLDGRTIRDIKAVGDGTWLISAGPANPGDDDGDDGNDDFQLYRWDGAHKVAQVEGVDLNTNAEATGGTAETLSNIQVHADGSVSVDVEYDNGTADWSGDGIESKDLDDAIQTFTSSTVTFDALPSLDPQPGDVAFTAVDENDSSFSFVALAAITPGATLIFESGDSRVTWTAPENGVAAGSVIGSDTHADQFDGELDLSLDNGVTVSDVDGEARYRLGVNDDDADLSLPAGDEAWQYVGATDGTAVALHDALNDADNWQNGDSDGGDENFIVETGHAPLGDPEPQDLGIAVSEIWSGQSGSDVTEDWFEITNNSDETIDFGQTPLYYDDDSADPEDAAQIQGLTTLAPGATAIVMVDGDGEAADEFRQAWSSDADLDGVEVGYTGSAAGLGGGGDQVTLWLGEPGRDTLAAATSYPDTDDNDAASWDVANQRFTTLDNGGVASDALGGDDDDTPAIATPGRLTADESDGGNEGGLLISEYVEGSGYNKAVELTNSGGDTLSLEGFQLSLYANGSETATASVDLGTFADSLAAGETLVIANSQADADLLARSDTTSGVINFNGNDAVALTDVDGALVDIVGTVGDATPFAQDVTLRRDAEVTTGSDSFDASQWQQLPQNTFDGLGRPGDQTEDGSGNDGDTGGDSGETLPPPGAVTLISAVQSSGMISPLEGQQVTLDAVVTLTSQAGLDGFFIQEQDADWDDNAQTSEGLFVYAPEADVAVGDQIRVSGTVTQYEGKTELSNVSALEVEARDQALPSISELTLPIADKSTLSAFEGMRVAMSGDNDSPLTVTDTYELGRYGTVTLSSGGRLEQYTEHHTPDQAGYQQWLDEAESRSIVLDDASNTQNPESVIFGRDGEPLSADNTLRGGDTLDQATGVLDFNYQQWRLQSSEGQDFQATNERRDTPDVDALGDASLKIASFNVLNYFTTLDENGNSVTTPAGTEHDPRGADSALELARQQDKIVSAINGSDADVVGLMEIENDGYGKDSAIANLIDALNTDDPDAEWAYVTPKDTGGDTVAPGGDAIAVGMIYKAGSVTPEGDAAVYEGDFAAGSRVPILQTFSDNTSGETFSVAVNHFKSKGSVIDGQDAIGDGQGNNNPARVEAAEQLADWVASDPTGSGDSDVLLIGDFNSYASEDPITTLEGDGFSLLDDDDSYSYDGQWGSLDHALANESMNAQVTGTTTWHINADEPTVFDYNTEYKSEEQVESFYDDGPYRASDHDPVIVGVNLGSNAESTSLMG
ncbi:ExeM/NucH family extracellular endonuclease [Salinicola corii]|nr:ExeM/NucH family extracellular endonuclease [Salinicola corii]